MIINKKDFFVIDNQEKKDSDKIKIFCSCGNKISYLDENMYFCNLCNQQFKRDVKNGN